MAFQKNHTFRGVVLSNAYFRVSCMTICNQASTANITVDMSASKANADANIVIESSNYFVDSINYATYFARSVMQQANKDPQTQANAYLATLVDFNGATEVND